MSGDIQQFLQTQKAEIFEETERLNLLEQNLEERNKNLNENRLEPYRKITVVGDFTEHDSEAKCVYPPLSDLNSLPGASPPRQESQQEASPVVEPLDLSGCYDFLLDTKKQALIDRLTRSEGPFFCGSADESRRFGLSKCGTSFGLPWLRRGEYAPPQFGCLRASPHEGLGEYEIRRSLLEAGQIRDCLIYSSPKNINTQKEQTDDSVQVGSSHSANTKHCIEEKSVQTDIWDINCELVVKHDFEIVSKKSAVTSLRTATDELVDAALRRPSVYPLRIDQRLTTAQNEALLRASTSGNVAMDKPKGILTNRRTGSPRDRYVADLGTHTTYNSTPYLDGFSYADRSDELERERLKREAYQHELRLQIEEKRRLTAMRDEQERRERELENRRLEQQLMRMREEQMQEDQRRQRRNELMRRHSDDLLRRKTELHEMQRPWRRHADSESANLDSMGLGNYSPPVSRRVSPYSSSATNYNVPPTSVFPDSSISSRYGRLESSSYPGGILRNRLSSYDTVPLPRSHRPTFDRFDSLSRIDSLSHRLETLSMRDNYSGNLSDVQRRHSATQQDLSRSPRLCRRNSSSRFEESLPVPMLKARSPVAKELRNAVPFSSQRSSDRWQQKLHVVESPVSTRGSILTQLGSIRAQLQREQLRMDESLHRRGLMRTRTTEDY
ncbi:uncharacterized protein [Euwallacea fornicatus]|uniref:uncharacterized protein isoform X1 n=1 Tax=Euwallacea fornicatus TaxID=995702 RepID=UPI00338D531E